MKRVQRLALMFFFGICSGLPLLLTETTLKAWLKGEGLQITVIGFFSLVGLPYTLKFIWAPAVDRLSPFFMERRRGWMVLTQFLLVLSIAALGLCQPKVSLFPIAVLAILTAFLSATQDIVLDAYRREILRDEELGLGSSFFITGYRVGMLISGPGSLFLAEFLSWSAVYGLLALLFVPAIILSLLAPDPLEAIEKPATWREAVVEPLREYFMRNRSDAFLILLFILLYKLGDAMAGSLATPFILDIGYAKKEIGAAQSLALVATLGGGFIGGLMMLRLGIRRSLWYFGFAQMISTLSYAWLSAMPHHPAYLGATFFIEYLAGGMGTSAFAAYMASLCNKRFTASQYALLSSLMGVPRVLLAAPSGFLARGLGWPGFFLACTLAALPGLYLLKRLDRDLKPSS